MKSLLLGPTQDLSGVLISAVEYTAKLKRPATVKLLVILVQAKPGTRMARLRLHCINRAHGRSLCRSMAVATQA